MVINNYYFIFLFFLFVSCSQQQKNTTETYFINYEYQNDLKIYCYKEFNVELKKNDTIIFLPLTSCASCVDYVLDVIIKNKYKSKLFIGGDFNEFENFIKRKDSIELLPYYFNDDSFLMYQYFIGVTSPIMIVKNGEKFKYTELSFDKIPFLLKKLNWLDPHM